MGIGLPLSTPNPFSTMATTELSGFFFPMAQLAATGLTAAARAAAAICGGGDSSARRRQQPLSPSIATWAGARAPSRPPAESTKSKEALSKGRYSLPQPSSDADTTTCSGGKPSLIAAEAVARCGQDRGIGC
ncbi:hypothetical protein Taro_051679 [Colocasia esculenta]|uniref:Uncharacterized protein n=1 Tax=Colocasia esculenta TaxID=4460 RepID=A0A843XHR7_COLES|nr:hypothetical protein [Colocasia esculenta]